MQSKLVKKHQNIEYEKRLKPSKNEQKMLTNKRYCGILYASNKMKRKEG